MVRALSLLVTFFLAGDTTAQPVVNGSYVIVTDAPCLVDNTGKSDTTTALQRCINTVYAHTVPRVPLFFPPGRYLVSDTIIFEQDNVPSDHDGINVVPARLLPHIAIGSSRGRATLVLAPFSPGFQNASAQVKPVVRVFNSVNDNVNMNNLFRSIDIDLTAAGNPGAAGLSFFGSQGACAIDVAVAAAPDTFACFLGINGAGGGHLGV